jgi:hypothetical protein
MVRLLGLGIVGFMLMGCDSSSYVCKSGSCDVTVSGKPEVNLGTKATSSHRGNGNSSTGRHRFKVLRYRDDAVTISSGAQSGTVRIGETTTIDDLIFQVRSIDPDGNGAKLHVEFA